MSSRAELTPHALCAILFPFLSYLAVHQSLPSPTSAATNATFNINYETHYPIRRLLDLLLPHARYLHPGMRLLQPLDRW